MNVLIIDAADNKEIKAEIKTDKKLYRINRKVEIRQPQSILILIDSLLKRSGLNLINIDKIKVNNGPGSFTGVRVGVSVANALSFLLKIPVNEKKTGIFVEPLY